MESATINEVRSDINIFLWNYVKNIDEIHFIEKQLCFSNFVVRHYPYMYVATCMVTVASV